MEHEYCAHEACDPVTGLKLLIRHDRDTINPREDYDHLATMSCWHRHYRLGDAHDWDSPDGFESAMTKIPHLRLPLHLYDHSGITMSTTPFHCPWDSGQVGWIWVSLEDIRKEFGVSRVTTAIREKAFALMRSEVREYDMYLTGDVWVIDIEDKDGELVDYCGGFYGLDHAREEGEALFAGLIADLREEIAQGQAAAIMAARPDMHGRA